MSNDSRTVVLTNNEPRVVLRDEAAVLTHTACDVLEAA